MFVSGHGSSAIKGLSVGRFAAFPPLPQPLRASHYHTAPAGRASQLRRTDGEPMREQRLTLCTPLRSPLLHSLESALSECCCFLPPGIALCLKMLQYEGRRGGFTALLRIHEKLALTF